MTSISDSAFVLLQPQGHLDAQGGNRLKQQFAAIPADSHQLWLVDLMNVNFIDSAGLLALVHGLKLAQRQQRRFVLCNPREAVKLTFEISQLDQIFEIIDTPLDINALASATESSLQVA